MSIDTASKTGVLLAGRRMFQPIAVPDTHRTVATENACAEFFIGKIGPVSSDHSTDRDYEYASAVIDLDQCGLSAMPACYTPQMGG